MPGNFPAGGNVVKKFVVVQYDVSVMDLELLEKALENLLRKPLGIDAQMFYDLLLKTYTEDEIVVSGRSLGATSLPISMSLKRFILDNCIRKIHYRV